MRREAQLRSDDLRFCSNQIAPHAHERDVSASKPTRIMAISLCMPGRYPHALKAHQRSTRRLLCHMRAGPRSRAPPSPCLLAHSAVSSSSCCYKHPHVGRSLVDAHWPRFRDAATRCRPSKPGHLDRTLAWMMKKASGRWWSNASSNRALVSIHEGCITLEHGEGGQGREQHQEAAASCVYVTNITQKRHVSEESVPRTLYE